MKIKRIIARLDVKNETLVKGVHLEGLRVLGLPESYAQEYYNDSVDELLYMDVVASLYGRNGLVELVKKTAEKIFIPLTVGGGIRTAADVTALLNSGADKVCINTAAVKNPQLIKTLSDKFGASTIVVAIEVIKDTDQSYKVYIDNGREYTGLDAIEWAKQAAELGAGEIVVTCVDSEGTGKGFNLELVDKIACSVSIPVIAHGGAGSAADILELFENTNVDAACAASIFHYDAVNRIEFDSSSVRGNTSFLRSNKMKKNLKSTSISGVKLILAENNIFVR